MIPILKLIHFSLRLLFLALVAFIVLNFSHQPPNKIKILDQQFFLSSFSCSPNQTFNFYQIPQNKAFNCNESIGTLLDSTSSIVINATLPAYPNHIVMIIEVCLKNVKINVVGSNDIFMNLTYASLILNDLSHCPVKFSSKFPENFSETLITECSETEECEEKMRISTFETVLVLVPEKLKENLVKKLPQKVKMVNNFMMISHQKKEEEISCDKASKNQDMLNMLENRPVLKPNYIKHNHKNNVKFKEIVPYFLSETQFEDISILYIQNQTYSSETIYRTILYLHEQNTLLQFPIKSYFHLHPSFNSYQVQLIMILLSKINKGGLTVISEQSRGLRLLEKNMVLNDIDVLSSSQVSEQPLKELINLLIENERKIRREQKPNNKFILIQMSWLIEESQLKNMKSLIGDIVENKGNITFLLIMNSVKCESLKQAYKILHSEEILNGEIKWFMIKQTEKKPYLIVPLSVVLNDDCKNIEKMIILKVKYKETAQFIPQKQQQPKKQIKKPEVKVNSAPVLTVRHNQPNIVLTPVQKYMIKFQIDDSKADACEWFKNADQFPNICQNLEQSCINYGEISIISYNFTNEQINIFVPSCENVEDIEYSLGEWSRTNLKYNYNVLYQLPYLFLQVFLTKLNHTLTISGKNSYMLKNTIINDIKLKTKVLEDPQDIPSYNIIFTTNDQYQMISGKIKKETYVVVVGDHIQISQQKQVKCWKNNDALKQELKQCKKIMNWCFFKVGQGQ